MLSTSTGLHAIAVLNSAMIEVGTSGDDVLPLGMDPRPPIPELDDELEDELIPDGTGEVPLSDWCLGVAVVTCVEVLQVDVFAVTYESVWGWGP